MSPLARDQLFEAVELAATVLPVPWTHGRDRLDGTLEGHHGTYDITLEVPDAREFRVRVASHERVPAAVAEQVDLLCMDAAWGMPTAGFYLSQRAGGAVVAAATIALNRYDEVPGPTILRNTIRECVLNAELVSLLAKAVVQGCTIDEARAHRPQLFESLAAGELGGMPAFCIPVGWAPADDHRLMDVCETAAAQADWATFRRADDQLVVGGETYVDLYDGCLIASTYSHEDVPAHRRSEVAKLLNRLLDDGAPFNLAIDLQTGTVVTRTVLDLRGLESLPHATLLCDVIYRSGAGSRVHRDAIARVADDRIDPSRPFGGGGTSLRDRLQATRAA
ncbi:MAG TPA: hypothetical protein VGF46_05595 [Gaiellales bacterium]|jgi:hypothetical protein